jgi:hypothetical protein
MTISVEVGGARSDPKLAMCNYLHSILFKPAHTVCVHGSMS